MGPWQHGLCACGYLVLASVALVLAILPNKAVSALSKHMWGKHLPREKGLRVPGCPAPGVDMGGHRLGLGREEFLMHWVLLSRNSSRGAVSRAGPCPRVGTARLSCPRLGYEGVIPSLFPSTVCVCRRDWVW